MIGLPMSIDAIAILDEALNAQERTGEQAYLGILQNASPPVQN
jgi:hypothetical protein